MSFALLGRILWYEALGFVMAVSIVLTGLVIYRTLVRSRNTATFAEELLAGYPLGLLGLGLFAIIARTGPVGQLSVVAAILILVVASVRRERRSWSPLLRSMPTVISFAAALSALFGARWHGPGSSYAGTRVLPDMNVYNSYAQFLHANLFPVSNLNTLECPLSTGYINLYPALLAASSSTSFADDAYLFYSVSCPMIMVVLLGLMAACLSDVLSGRNGERPDRSTIQMLAAGALMAGAWRYPSWFVESPPAAFAIPLCVIIYFYSIRPRHSTSLGLSIAIGAVMTKVVSLVPLAAASVGSLLESAGSKKLKIGRLAVLLLGCIVAIPIFLKFKTVITSRLFLMPSSVWEIKGHGLGFFAFSEIARDLGLLAAIVAAARSRSFRILCVVVVGAMSYWVSLMTFRWVMSATIILFAIEVLQCRVLYERSRSLVFVASALFLCATISNGFFSEERASVLFLCFWLLWVLVFPIMFCPRVDGSEADTWFGGRKRIRVKVICALAMGSVILSAVTPGIYGLLERRGKVARSQLVYEMWMTVRREVPGDGLVFVERRSGDEFVSYGRRQVFVSGRRIGGLRRDEAVMGEMERFNTDVLSGRRLPGEWPVAGEFGAFYAVLSKRRVPPAHFSLVYGNKRQRLYEIRTEGVPTDQERPPSLSERTE